MSNFTGKESIDVWMETQKRMLELWEEYLEENNNTQILKMFGDDCKDALNRCQNIQQKMISLWHESINEFQPYNMMSNFGERSYNIWKEWWQMQEKFIQKMQDEMDNKNVFRNFGFVPIATSKSNTPIEAAKKFQESWLKMMNETAEVMSKQWAISGESHKTSGQASSKSKGKSEDKK